MPRRMGMWAAGLVLVAIVAACGYAWFHRAALLTRHYTLELAANPDVYDTTVAKIAALGTDGRKALLHQVGTGDPRLVETSRRLLMAFAATDAAHEHTRMEIAGAAVEAARFATPQGQGALFLLAADLLEDREPPPTIWSTLAQCQPSVSEARQGWLALAASAAPAEATVSQELVRRIEQALADGQPACRRQAVVLAAQRGGAELAAVGRWASAHHDPDAAVRGAVVSALGNNEDLLPTEELLKYLQDTSPEVRVLTTQALRSRGLTAEQVQLARMLTDPQPAVRAAIPGKVLEIGDVDVGVWFERLSKDPSPAVRAAVYRAAGESGEGRWQPWLQKQAAAEGNPTAKAIAGFYLQEHR